ncbi:MAG: hypothetical protein LUF92_15115, partial [Clostridiales bacterium]|nr:hypothetical protein [Clostridiales bacterium]
MPTYLDRDWPILVLCILTESAASIISARFANRVNSRIVGLVTGAVLTVIGIVMLGMNYRTQIASIPLLVQILMCFGGFLAFILVLIAGILLIRRIFTLPQEVSRKLLQFPAMTCVLVMLLFAETWFVAVICAAIFTIALYPILSVFEKYDGYKKLFVERRKGEVKRSLLLLFGTHIVIVAVSWGVWERPYFA